MKVTDELLMVARAVRDAMVAEANDVHQFEQTCAGSLEMIDLHALIAALPEAAPQDENCTCEREPFGCPTHSVEARLAEREYQRGVREEREACARLAETHIDKHAGAPDGGSFCVHHIVRDIRARSQDAAAQDERVTPEPAARGTEANPCPFCGAAEAAEVIAWMEGNARDPFSKKIVEAYQRGIRDEREHVLSWALARIEDGGVVDEKWIRLALDSAAQDERGEGE